MQKISSSMNFSHDTHMRTRNPLYDLHEVLCEISDARRQHVQLNATTGKPVDPRQLNQAIDTDFYGHYFNVRADADSELREASVVGRPQVSVSLVGNELHIKTSVVSVQHQRWFELEEITLPLESSPVHVYETLLGILEQTRQSNVFGLYETNLMQEEFQFMGGRGMNGF